MYAWRSAILTRSFAMATCGNLPNSLRITKTLQPQVWHRLRSFYLCRIQPITNVHPNTTPIIWHHAVDVSTEDIKTTWSRIALSSLRTTKKRALNPVPTIQRSTSIISLWQSGNFNHLQIQNKQLSRIGRHIISVLNVETGHLLALLSYILDSSHQPTLNHHLPQLLQT